MEMDVELQITALEDILFYFQYLAQVRSYKSALDHIDLHIVSTAINHSFIPKYFKGRYLPEIIYIDDKLIRI